MDLVQPGGSGAVAVFVSGKGKKEGWVWRRSSGRSWGEVVTAALVCLIIATVPARAARRVGLEVRSETVARAAVMEYVKVKGEPGTKVRLGVEGMGSGVRWDFPEELFLGENAEEEVGILLPIGEGEMRVWAEEIGGKGGPDVSRAEVVLRRAMENPAPPVIGGMTEGNGEVKVYGRSEAGGTVCVTVYDTEMRIVGWGRGPGSTADGGFEVAVRKVREYAGAVLIAGVVVRESGNLSQESGRVWGRLRADSVEGEARKPSTPVISPGAGSRSGERDTTPTMTTDRGGTTKQAEEGIVVFGGEATSGARERETMQSALSSETVLLIWEEIPRVAAEASGRRGWDLAERVAEKLSEASGRPVVLVEGERHLEEAFRREPGSYWALMIVYHHGEEERQGEGRWWRGGTRVGLRMTKETGERMTLHIRETKKRGEMHFGGNDSMEQMVSEILRRITH